MRVRTTRDTLQRDALTIVCDVPTESDGPEPVTIRIDTEGLVLAVGDVAETLGPANPIRRNTLAAGDTVRGVVAFGLWTAAYQQSTDAPVDIARIMLASTALATAKCYSGSFVDFLRRLEQLRGSPLWRAMWTAPG